MTFRAHKLAAGAALALLLLAGDAGAQNPQLRTIARTGLVTLYPGRTARLHLVQLAGSPVQPTQVTLRLIDDRGKQVARIDGELRANGTLRLSLRNPANADRAGVPIRAEATLRTSTNNFGTMPFLTLEIVDDRTLDLVAVESCPIPYDPRDPAGPTSGSCGCVFENDIL